MSAEFNVPLKKFLDIASPILMDEYDFSPRLTYTIRVYAQIAYTHAFAAQGRSGFNAAFEALRDNFKINLKGTDEQAFVSAARIFTELGLPAPGSDSA